MGCLRLYLYVVIAVALGFTLAADAQECKSHVKCNRAMGEYGVKSFCIKKEEKCPSGNVESGEGFCADKDKCKCCIPKECERTEPSKICRELGEAQGVVAKCKESVNEKDCRIDGGTWYGGHGYPNPGYVRDSRCCSGCCVPKNHCLVVNEKFKNKHVCDRCIDGSGTQGTGARYFANKARPPKTMEFTDKDGKVVLIPRTTVFSNVDGISYITSTHEWDERPWDTCKIKEPVKTWTCYLVVNEKGEREYEKTCRGPKLCTGEYVAWASSAKHEIGHFIVDSRSKSPDDCRKW